MPISISGAIVGYGLKTSILGDCTKKCQHPTTQCTSNKDLHLHWTQGSTYLNQYKSMSCVLTFRSTMHDALIPSLRLKTMIAGNK
jgi:virulence-associated protein VapD